MRVTQSGCLSLGYFRSNWTGLVVFSMLIEAWPTVCSESPDSVVPLWSVVMEFTASPRGIH